MCRRCKHPNTFSVQPLRGRKALKADQEGRIESERTSSKFNRGLRYLDSNGNDGPYLVVKPILRPRATASGTDLVVELGNEAVKRPRPIFLKCIKKSRESSVAQVQNDSRPFCDLQPFRVFSVGVLPHRLFLTIFSSRMFLTLTFSYDPFRTHASLDGWIDFGDVLASKRYLKHTSKSPFDL